MALKLVFWCDSWTIWCRISSIIGGWLLLFYGRVLKFGTSQQCTQPRLSSSCLVWLQSNSYSGSREWFVTKVSPPLLFLFKENFADWRWRYVALFAGVAAFREEHFKILEMTRGFMGAILFSQNSWFFSFYSAFEVWCKCYENSSVRLCHHAILQITFPRKRRGRLFNFPAEKDFSWKGADITTALSLTVC